MVPPAIFTLTGPRTEVGRAEGRHCRHQAVAREADRRGRRHHHREEGREADRAEDHRAFD